MTQRRLLAVKHQLPLKCLLERARTELERLVLLLQCCHPGFKCAHVRMKLLHVYGYRRLALMECAASMEGGPPSVRRQDA